VKSFGLGHATPEQLAEAFVEIRPLLGQCRFRNCRHREEPGCAVRAAVEEGRVAWQRLELLLELIDESAYARSAGR
jgi:ribosome biogenesis GTPase